MKPLIQPLSLAVAAIATACAFSSCHPEGYDDDRRGSRYGDEREGRYERSEERFDDREELRDDRRREVRRGYY